MRTRRRAPPDPRLFERVKVSESTIANQLSAIARQVATTKDGADFSATAAGLRVAAAVFGA